MTDSAAVGPAGLAREAELKDLLVRIVGAPSYPGLPRQEEAVVRILGEFLRGSGIEPQIYEVDAGRPNLLASIQGSLPGPHLLLCGHTDTVPPNAESSIDLLSPREEKGRLFGRGTVDMKGALAAMAGALVACRHSGRWTRGTLTLAAVIDEEMESLGTERLIRDGFRADAAIVGEPTNNAIAIGHKGLEWLQVSFDGKASHGGTSERGINAIAAAAHFVHMVEKELVAEFEKRRDALLGLPTINIGTITGGDQPSTVAAHCRLSLDRRWVTTETIEQVFDDLESILAEVRQARPGLRTVLSRVPGGMATMLHGPMTIDAGHAIVQSAAGAFADLAIPLPALTVFPAWTDGALLSREAGIPTVIWGPGDLALAHSPQESVQWSDVVTASRLYAAAALRFARSE